RRVRRLDPGAREETGNRRGEAFDRSAVERAVAGVELAVSRGVRAEFDEQMRPACLSVRVTHGSAEKCGEALCPRERPGNVPVLRRALLDALLEQRQEQVAF